MFSFQESNSDPQHASWEHLPVLDPDEVRILGIYNPGSGHADEALNHLDQLSRTHDVTSLKTEYDNPAVNAQNLAAVVEITKPEVIVSLGGDYTAMTVTGAVFRAAEKNPAILDIPLVFLPYGTGNDFPLSLVNNHDLLHILRHGQLYDFRATELTVRPPHSEPETLIAAGSAGVGALGTSAFHINHEETHGHEDFKHPVKKHLLLARAAITGFATAQPFTMEEKDENDTYGPELKIFERAFFHALRFGIHGRTAGRISDGHLREAVLHGKWTPRTAFYMGCFAAGRTGIKIPSHPVHEVREFRVTPAEGHTLYAHIDDTEIPLESGSEIKVGLSEASARVYATRRRP